VNNRSNINFTRNTNISVCGITLNINENQLYKSDIAIKFKIPNAVVYKKTRM
jgi:hypothetical protein